MLVIAGRFKVLESARAELLTAGSTMAEASRNESGCFDYRLSIDVDDPLTLQILEQWESQAALDAHFATTHFAEFSGVLMTAIDGGADFSRYEVASSGPLFG